MSGSGAITRLVAIGAQDVHITGNPEISFFKSTHKRHTNFSLFQEQQTIAGNPSAGNTSTITIRRSGDLLNYCFMTIEENATSKLISDWRDVIEEAELYIGDQRIDTQTSEFTEELAIDLFASSFSKSYQASLHGGVGSDSYFYPFRFFFCENWGYSLPLVAIQYSDVRIKIKWSSSLNSNYKPKFFASYVALDAEERARFANPETKTMLIHQVQRMEPSNDTVQNLYFNHPIKFIASSNAASDNNLVSITNKVRLEVNGNDITENQISVPYFTSVPTYYHTDFSSSTAESIFFYPFSINVNRYQMTGTLNFSRIDSFRIHCTNNINRPIYAVNYNFLKIKNGIAGLMYAD
jgi:hypothetical protein